MQPDDPARRPRPWWRDLRWLTALAACVSAGVWLWGLLGPEPRVVVSRETTFITEPLRPDGLPDYRAHVLDLLGRGGPPADNAAVAVLEATWPMDLDDADLAVVCEELGIPATPPGIAPLVGAEEDQALSRQLAEVLDIDGHADPSPDGDPAVDRAVAMGEVIDRSRSEPWSAADCPPLADWVARNAAALDHVVAAAARPRYVMPAADLLATGPAEPVLVAALPDVQTLRNVARALATRAMLHAGEGRHADAWRDVHAIHRYSRLLAPGGRSGFMVQHLVSVALGGMANALTLELLQAPELSAGTIAEIRRDLAALPPRADAAAALVMERLGGLDVVMLLPRARREDWSASLDVPVGHLRTSLDVNVVLREVNAYYDRVDTVARVSDRTERRRLLDELETDLLATLRVSGPLQAAGWWLRMATSRSARSADTAARVLCMLAPAVESYVNAIDRARAEFDLLRVAAALAEYRARGLGGPGVPYPDRLDALVPDLLADLPGDPFAGRPLVYERRGDGYLLYAVGTNGVDDGGTSGDIVKGEWQPPDPTGSGPEFGLDNVIRVPTRREGLVPPKPPREEAPGE